MHLRIMGSDYMVSPLLLPVLFSFLLCVFSCRSSFLKGFRLFSNGCSADRCDFCVLMSLGSFLSTILTVFPYAIHLLSIVHCIFCIPEINLIGCDILCSSVSLDLI